MFLIENKRMENNEYRVHCADMCLEIENEITRN